jgi:hypothetical protein
MEPFEEHLCRQPLREVPADWRREILSAARAEGVPEVSRRAVRESLAGRFRRRLNTWLWPHPVAWSVLGVCWVVILAVNLSLHEPVPLLAKKSLPMNADALAEFKRERLLLVELAGAQETPDVDRAKKNAQQPRTEYVKLAVV